MDEKQLISILEKYRTEEEIETSLQLIRDINRLKKEKNAVILGHNYMTPDIFYGVSDITGDSLYLANEASKVEADIIVFNGVHFMAETAKILNPTRKVLMADLQAGCSLAESITPNDIIEFRENHPGVPVVTYINSSAKVKAHSDVICTSANAVKVIESIPEETIFFIPDYYLAQNTQKLTKKKIIAWNGKCMVHELFSETDIQLARKTFPGVQVLAHPECKPEVTKISDFTGSTSQIEKYIEEKHPSEILLLTECSMGENIKSSHQQINFVSTCQICPHMHKITLEGIYQTLLHETNAIEVPEEIAEGARKALNRMLEIGR